DRLAHAYDVRLALIGLLTTVVFATQTATQIPAGRAIDRFGARAVGAAAVGAIAVGDAVALAEKSFWLAVAGRALTGLGTGSAFICGTDLARAAGGRPLAQGVYGGSSVGGVGIAIAVVPQLAGWRAPYWGSPAVCALVVLGRGAWPAAWLSLAAGAAGCALLASPAPPAALALGAVVVGLAAGLPFAPAINRAQTLRRDAPAAAVGVVNGFANLVILVTT